MKNYLIGLLITIALVSAAVATYYYGQRASTPTQDTAPQPTQTTTTQIETSPAPTKSNTIYELPTSAPTINNDEDVIRAALIAKNQWDESINFTLTTTSNDGTYAHGLVNSDGGGGYWYAAKVNGNWQIVADGNGVITCESLEPYPDYPTSLISQCYNQTSGDLETR